MVNTLPPPSDTYDSCEQHCEFDQSTYRTLEMRRRARVLERKSKASARERTRVRAMAAAFSKLRERLPRHPAEYQLTQSQTVNRAIEYIHYLQGQIGKQKPANDERSVRADHWRSSGWSSPSSPATSEDSAASDDSSSSSSSLCSSISFGRLIPTHRVKWNIMCRERSRQIAESFEVLRNVLGPAEVSDESETQHTSQLHTLRRAITYIRSLREVLQQMEKKEERKEEDDTLLKFLRGSCGVPSATDDLARELLSPGDLAFELNDLLQTISS